MGRKGGGQSGSNGGCKYIGEKKRRGGVGVGVREEGGTCLSPAKTIMYV